MSVACARPGFTQRFTVLSELRLPLVKIANNVPRRNLNATLLSSPCLNWPGGSWALLGLSNSNGAKVADLPTGEVASARVAGSILSAGEEVFSSEPEVGLVESLELVGCKQTLVGAGFPYWG